MSILLFISSYCIVMLICFDVCHVEFSCVDRIILFLGDGFVIVNFWTI